MVQARKPPAPAPKRAEPKPAPPPAPRPVQSPRPAPVRKPEPARPPESKPADRPRPEPKEKPGAADRGKTSTSGGRTEAKPGDKRTALKRESSSPEATAAGGPAPTGPGDLSGDQAAQEVQVLRQQVGDLAFGSTWQAADPPKSSGRFGIALQGVETGNNLRQAGAVLANGLGKAADTTGRIVTLVKNHKPPTYEVKK